MSTSAAPSTSSIHPGTRLGAVSLTVADLEGEREFYETALGLRALERAQDAVRLGADDGVPLVELVGRPDAPPRPPRTTGLFHLALLVPTRADLARAVHRVVAAGRRFTGASDHLVSEALYLSDLEGNGIEIYRDRARSAWPRADGAPQMATEPLDLDGVLGELSPGEPAGAAPPGTLIGHVHLQVDDLAAAESFYHALLGFDVTVRGYPGALFVSAGGYHHHVGLNTWAGEGIPPPPAGARGLRSFEVVLPDGELERVAGRLAAAGVDREENEGAVQLADPAGNRLVLRAAIV